MTSPAQPRRGFKPTGEPYPNPVLDGALLANQEDEAADRREHQRKLFPTPAESREERLRRLLAGGEGWVWRASSGPKARGRVNP